MRYLLFGLVLIFAGCGAPASPTAIPMTSTPMVVATMPAPTATPVPRPTPTVTPIPGVGAMNIAMPWVVTLNSATINGDGVLVTDITAELMGDQPGQLASLANFFARDSNGYNLERTYRDCGEPLNGTVFPGNKLSGKLCWAGATYPITVFFIAKYNELPVQWRVEQ